MSDKIVKIMPNVMTCMRLLMVPAFLYAWFHPDMVWPGRRFALAVFLAASATDMMDGYIARKYHAISNFGKLADPVADKLLVFSALYCLYRSDTLPLWYLLVIGGKELLLVAGGALMLRLGVVVQSKLLGKAACFIMVVGIGASIAELGLGIYILYAALLMHILALASYGMETIVIIKGKAEAKRE